MENPSQKCEICAEAGPSGVASSISEGDIFIYLCSAQLTSFKIDLISKEINCAEQEYMNMSPSLIELATPLAGPNQTKLPRHYIRRKFKAETHLEQSGENLCDKCLFEIERDVYSVRERIERWTVTCKDDKCTQPANFYNCSWQYLCYMCYARTYCQIHCSVCNIPHKCKDIDCVETLAKANKMVYE